MGAGLLHSLLLKVKYHLLQQPVQPVIRIIPMYTTRRKVPDFSLVKSHACIFERRVTQILFVKTFVKFLMQLRRMEILLIKQRGKEYGNKSVKQFNSKKKRLLRRQTENRVPLRMKLKKKAHHSYVGLYISSIPRLPRTSIVELKLIDYE